MVRLLAPAQVAAEVGLARRLGADLVDAGLAGTVYAADVASRLVRADAVAALADRPPVTGPHPGGNAALVLRVTPATRLPPQAAAAQGRQWAGFGAWLPQPARRDAVTCWWPVRRSDVPRLTGLDDPWIPVVVSLRTFVVDCFYVASIEVGPGLRARLHPLDDGGLAQDQRRVLERFHDHRLPAEPGGPMRWISPAG